MSIWNSQWQVDCLDDFIDVGVIKDGIDLATATSWNDHIRMMIPMEDAKQGYDQVLITIEQARDLSAKLLLAADYIEADNKQWGSNENT